MEYKDVKLIVMSDSGYFRMTPEYFELKRACLWKFQEDELADEVTRQTIEIIDQLDSSK